MGLRARTPERPCSGESYLLNLVEFLGPEASINARGQLERVLRSRLPDRLEGNLDVLPFGNLEAPNRLEHSVLEDGLDRDFHQLTGLCGQRVRRQAVLETASTGHRW